MPLVAQGETVGRLLLAARRPGEKLSDADRRVLEMLSAQAGPAVLAVRLNAQLARSREQLVSAREEERRRLRRDLHDGLGPTLAAIGMQLAAASALLDRPDELRALHAELQEQTRQALADIRRLVYDLRPPALDELGLGPAIAQQGQRFAGLAVDVHAEGDLGDLPAAVEVAAYRIAAEAITNAARHGAARTCSVRLSLNGALDLEVVDDGTGITDAARAGVGLSSMRERAAELGGSCEVGPAPGGGTRVRARLPVATGVGVSRAARCGDEALRVLVDREADQRRDPGDAPESLRVECSGKQVFGREHVVGHGRALDQVGLGVDERVECVAVDAHGLAGGDARRGGHAPRMREACVTCPAAGVTGACRSAPALVAHDALERDPPAGLEVGAERVSDGDQRDLLNAVVRDAEDLGGVALASRWSVVQHVPRPRARAASWKLQAAWMTEPYMTCLTLRRARCLRAG